MNKFNGTITEETKFIDIVNTHRELVQSEIRNMCSLIPNTHEKTKENSITVALLAAGTIHDKDKIVNKEIFDIYDKHYCHLRLNYKFGTDAYNDYCEKHLKSVWLLHDKQGHHYSASPVEQHPDITIIDMLEAICDVFATEKFFNKEDNAAGVIDKTISTLIRQGTFKKEYLEVIKKNSLKEFPYHETSINYIIEILENEYLVRLKLTDVLTRMWKRDYWGYKERNRQYK